MKLAKKYKKRGTDESKETPTESDSKENTGSESVLAKIRRTIGVQRRELTRQTSTEWCGRVVARDCFATSSCTGFVLPLLNANAMDGVDGVDAVQSNDAGRGCSA